MGYGLYACVWACLALVWLVGLGMAGLWPLVGVCGLRDTDSPPVGLGLGVPWGLYGVRLPSREAVKHPLRHRKAASSSLTTDQPPHATPRPPNPLPKKRPSSSLMKPLGLNPLWLCCGTVFCWLLFLCCQVFYSIKSTTYNKSQGSTTHPSHQPTAHPSITPQTPQNHQSPTQPKHSPHRAPNTTTPNLPHTTPSLGPSRDPHTPQTHHTLHPTAACHVPIRPIRCPSPMGLGRAHPSTPLTTPPRVCQALHFQRTPLPTHPLPTPHPYLSHPPKPVRTGAFMGQARTVLACPCVPVYLCPHPRAPSPHPAGRGRSAHS